MIVPVVIRNPMPPCLFLIISARLPTTNLTAISSFLWLISVTQCKGDWAQDSRRILSNITDCGYGTTHLQENPQRLG